MPFTPDQLRSSAAHAQNSSNQLMLAARYLEGPHIRNEFRSVRSWIDRQAAFFAHLADQIEHPPTPPGPP